VFVIRNKKELCNAWSATWIIIAPMVFRGPFVDTLTRLNIFQFSDPRFRNDVTLSVP
jgi:hypothetical protein